MSLLKRNNQASPDMKYLELEQICHKFSDNRQMEYLQINKDFHILDASKQVEQFADCPSEVMLLRDVRLGFPELIGVEDILIDILEGREKYFEVKGIARFRDNYTPFYIDLYAINLDRKLLIFFENATSRMVLQQNLTQANHEANILLRKLTASQNYLDNLLTSIADVLLVTNSFGKIKRVNQAAIDLFCYSEAELLDKHISAIINGEELFSKVNQEDSSGQTKFLHNCEIVCQTKTGDKVFVAFSAAVIQTGINENSPDLVYIGRDITERKRSLARISAEHATTRILSESANLEEATPKILEVICEYLEWEVGELWLLDEQANVLRYLETWHLPSVDIPEFLLLSRQMTFSANVGLPGRVWGSGEPIWIEDVFTEANFLRTSAAIQEGLRSAFGFPIKNGGKILGVITFFCQKIQPLHDDLLMMMTTIGSQMGQFIKRKQAEAGLAESEELFQAFMNNSPTVAFMKDEAGRNVYMNKQLERIFNIKSGDLQGKTDFDWLPHDTAKQVHENDLYVMSTGKAVEVIEAITAPDGSLCYWLVFKFPFENARGQKFVGGVAVDISDRYRLEKELFEEKELAQVTLQSIGDAVITTDAESKIRFLNPIAEQLTGWSQQSAQGKPLTEVFQILNEITREPVENPVQQALREGNIVSLAKDTVLISRNGNEFAIEDSAAPIRTLDGEIIGAVMVFHDVTTARALARQLSWQASHDALTGLVNRREFESCVTQSLIYAKTQNQQHALCYLDLDQFKIVNDTCGHIVGDELLRQVTALFQAQIRSTDILARLGGDEFGILLNHCSLESALPIAKMLRESIETFRFVWQNKTFKLGVSIGLVEINEKSETVTTVLSAADAACYAAKNNGRNRVHIYQPDDTQLTQQQGEVQWVARINQALEENRFCLYYQTIVPIKQCKNGEHYEVLLRLVDEVGNLVLPTAFIRSAERYNLMQTLDRWVIRTLFATQGQHYRETWKSSQSQKVGCGCLYAINLSGASINDEQFIEFLHEQFALYQIPPALICFEITETVAIANLIKAAQFIRSLREIGCHFALDDFGSGMSSFAYLKNLPVDYLKIDGSFIKNIVDDPIDLAMVEAINQIGHVMGIKTIAEFVENQEILAKITALGVDYAQGYAIAKPRPF
ncbi:EAL domain-containing protein [Plectonema radiosum NIES-515]|uniref:EAL domain-containing protein n=1 Tax=Plectonema radiosum NIES-515 TaxID=2986073 RepID=A0ABT3AYM1_9CYAN|nr:EAL domain-containing protein [Plectonema radiosum]MCV3214228.1 EAL domain-containing protein [Plectonema radiosum NIES-515]